MGRTRRVKGPRERGTEGNKEEGVSRSLASGDKRSSGVRRARGSISGGGKFFSAKRRRSALASPPSLHPLFLLPRCNRRLYYFRERGERERACDGQRKIRGGFGEYDRGRRGCLTHTRRGRGGGSETRREGDRAAGNARADSPPSPLFSSLPPPSVG